ncbi:MAG: amidohydrolase, partial [Gammaproteobacteria bacterium]|nr:amidohydrolase [Gammaproteobacteria bacterium]
MLTGCGENKQTETLAVKEQPVPASSSKIVSVAPADLVLLGGKIVTVDDSLGTVEAIAIRAHEIQAVGTNEEINRYIGKGTRTIELDGKLVIPGFIEGHGHYLSLGRARQILDLTGVDNWEQIVSKVSQAVDSSEEGEWIFGRGWHQEKWDSLPEDSVEGVPTNQTLNSISPNNPVYLGHASGHASYANDAALAAGGIDDDTSDPAGGTIVRTKDGKATGLLRENAQDLVEGAIDEYLSLRSEKERDQILRERVQLAGKDALFYGVTSFHDAGSSFETIDFFKQMEDEGNLPIRLYVMVRNQSNEEMAEKLSDYKMVADGNDFLTVRSIKRQIDGALGAHGAWLLEPYDDLPSTAGLVLEPVEEIERTAELAVENGFQVNIHAIGTRANRESLDIYERIWEKMDVSGKDLRWRVEHAQHIHPNDVPRFGQLGVIAAMQGIHCTSDGPWIPSRLGEERTGITSYPWRDLINTGAIIGNGTDVPVEPIDPFASFYASVTRMTNKGKLFYPEHVMTRMEALKSYTINNAYAAFEEDIKGSLTPGKLADIVVLSQDIMTVPAE